MKKCLIITLCFISTSLFGTSATLPDYTNRTDVDTLCNKPRHHSGSAHWDPTSYQLFAPGYVWGAMFTYKGGTYRAICK